MKAIGIEAISFVGTTLLAAILGSHPRCHNAGHCYVLFEPWREKKGLEEGNVCIICSFLDKGCKSNLLTEFEINPIFAYDVMEHIILEDGEDILIDASSVTKWFDMTQPDDIVFMFRDPLTLASSYIKTMYPKRERKWILNYMCKAYNKKYAVEEGLAISYNNLLDDNVYIRGLFSKLRLEFSADYLEYWNYPQHMPRGNKGLLLKYAQHHRPERVDGLIAEICNGNKEYEKYYRDPDWDKKGGVNLLTPEEEDSVMDRCGAIYEQLKGLEACLL